MLSALTEPTRLYFFFRIPKRTVGFREISQPRESLLRIQHWILSNILDALPVHEAASAFHAKASIRKNAAPHLQRPMVLSLDVRDFFPSISPDRVGDTYRRAGYSMEVAALLTRLTTLNDGLPQGAPTSPALSNHAMLEIDTIFSALSERRAIAYTRYADDLTFSGQFDAGWLVGRVRRTLKEFGLQLNEDKTRLMLPHQRQEVTGVVTNARLQAPRHVRRKLRQEVHYIERFGEEEHTLRKAEGLANRLDHLRGVAEHIRFLNPVDRDAISARRILGPVRYKKPSPR